MSLYTIPELAAQVRDGLRSPESAGILAMDRREANLCDRCPATLPTFHDYERDSLCQDCRRKEYGE